MIHVQYVSLLYNLQVFKQISTMYVSRVEDEFPPTRVTRINTVHGAPSQIPMLSKKSNGI